MEEEKNGIRANENTETDAGMSVPHKRSFFGGFFGALGLLAVGDLAAVLLRFVFLLFFSGLFAELKANAPSAARVAYFVSYLLCFAAFIFTAVFATLKNGYARNNYLISTYGKSYGIGSDALSLLKSALPAYLAASAIFALPIHIIFAVFGEVKYITTVFIPFYCMYKMTGSRLAASYSLSVLLPTAALWLSVFFAHIIWEKNRLHK